MLLLLLLLQSLVYHIIIYTSSSSQDNIISLSTTKPEHSHENVNSLGKKPVHEHGAPSNCTRTEVKMVKQLSIVVRVLILHLTHQRHPQV